MHKLAQCLLETQNDSNGQHAASRQLHQWRVELMALFLCWCAGNPKAKAEMLSLNMAEGSFGEDQVPSNSGDGLLVSAVACVLVVMCHAKARKTYTTISDDALHAFSGTQHCVNCCIAHWA